MLARQPVPPGASGAFTTRTGSPLYTLTPRQMAWRLAQDLPAGQQPWLGPGLPQLLREFLPQPAANTPTPLAVVEAASVTTSGQLHCSHELPPATARLWVLAPLFGHDGLPTLVEQLTQPTASPVPATLLYSDIAIFELRAGQAWLRALTEGITLHTLQMELDVELRVSPELTLLQIPATLGGHY